MTYISKNKQSFGIVAKDYKKYRGSYNTKLYEKFFKTIGKSKGKIISILDLGCGVGNSTEPILLMAKKLKTVVSVMGCDPDNNMLIEARKSGKKNHLPIVYKKGSAEKIPFKKENFDVILSGAAFHWFATTKAMREIKRVLRKDGMYFVFWTQNIKSKKPTIGHELYKKYGFKGIPKDLRDPEFIKNIFMKNGFKKVNITKIPYTETKTINGTIGLIKTNSGYAVLSEENKNIFIKEMEKEYKKKLGKNKNILNQEIHICYGFK